jgi:hypothetical protein
MPKESVGVALIPGADFLIAEPSVVYLLSHEMLQIPKRSKQDSRYCERDLVEHHKE